MYLLSKLHCIVIIACLFCSDSNGDSGGRISPPDSDFPIISKDSVSHLHQLTEEEKRENYQLKVCEIYSPIYIHNCM